jgi:hypothetical protein
MTISTAATSLPHLQPSTAALPAWWPIAAAASQLRSLDPEQCLRLLPDAGHGWLSYPRQPDTLPAAVVYQIRGRAVLLAPGPDGDGSALAPAPLVLFRVDHLNADQSGGWSIVAAGPLCAEEDSTDDGSPAAAAVEQPELVLNLEHLAGRFVVVGDRPSLRAVR